MGRTLQKMKNNNGQTRRQPGKFKHRLFLVVLLLFVGSFGYWATNSNLEIVSVAEGEVKPEGETKSIQHLEGGIVRDILVEEGDEVSKGQPIIVLESTLNEADVKELEARLDFLRIQMIRLEAEVGEGDEPRFTDKLERKNRKLVRQEKKLYAARQDKLLNEIKISEERINQRSQEIKETDAGISATRAEISETKARLKNNQSSHILIKEQIAISEDLLKDDLTNRFNHLNLLKEANLLKSEIEEDEAVLLRHEATLVRHEAILGRQRSSVRDTQSLKKNIRLVFSQEVRVQLEESQKEFREIKERLRKAKDSLKRTVLRSPVSGIVKKLRIVTKGGVVPPGGKIVDIIPAEGSLVIEARLPPYDIGYVSIGQKGTIKLKSSDAIRFGSIAIKVTHISPDTFVESDGSAYYKVILEPATDYFKKGSSRYNLVPGVEVVSSIHTGERSVLKYIFEPFLTSAGSALQER